MFLYHSRWKPKPPPRCPDQRHKLRMWMYIMYFDHNRVLTQEMELFISATYSQGWDTYGFIRKVLAPPFLASEHIPGAYEELQTQAANGPEELSCRMSMSEQDRYAPSSIFGTSAECRYQSWLDIRPSSIFGTIAEWRRQSWLDIRPS